MAQVPVAPHARHHGDALEQLGVAGGELAAALILAERRLAVLPNEVVVVSQREMGLRQVGRQRRSPIGGRLRLRGARGRRQTDLVDVGVGPAQLRPGESEAGVERHGPLVVADRPPELDRSPPGRSRPRPRCPGGTARTPAGWPWAFRPAPPARERRVPRPWPAPRGMPRRPGPGTRPSARRRTAAATGGRRRHLDQLGAHPHPALTAGAPLPADLAGEEVIHAELAPDLTRGLGALRYCLELLEAVTWSPGRPASLPRISSVMPSAK